MTNAERVESGTAGERWLNRAAERRQFELRKATMSAIASSAPTVKLTRNELIALVWAGRECTLDALDGKIQELLERV